MHPIPETSWKGYELLAIGDGQRLERWGERVILRPESAARGSWKSGVVLPAWEGRYTGDRATGGSWEWKNPLPSPCVVQRGPLSYLIKQTASKHLGLFPEQGTNWDWISEMISKTGRNHPPKVLNLFGYTGGATLSAAIAGAAVTHVDSSKAMVSWCSENARLSGLGEAPIRYLVEDAMTFLEREIRRGNRYDGVIMDPPSYGRGKDGKLWKLSDHLGGLLESTLAVMVDSPLFMLLNTYSPELDHEAGVMFEEFLSPQNGRTLSVPMGLTGSLDDRFLPLGQSHRWMANS